MLEEIGIKMLIQGEMTSLQGWLNRLPADLLRSRPRICTIHTCVLAVNGELDAIEPFLKNAEEKLSDNNQDYASQIQGVRGEVAAMRGTIAAVQQNTSLAIELSHEALEDLPENSLPWRRMVIMSLGIAHWGRGDIAQARQNFSEASVPKETDSNSLADLITTCSTCLMADMEAIQGHLQQAFRIYSRILSLTDRQGIPLFPLVSMAYTGMGEVLYEWNDLEAAECHLLKGLDLDRKGANLEVRRGGYITLARVKKAKGDIDGALDTIDEGGQLARTHGCQLIGRRVLQTWVSPPAPRTV